MADDPLPEDPTDWDLDERDRWMDEHDDGDRPDPTLTVVEVDE